MWSITLIKLFSRLKCVRNNIDEHLSLNRNNIITAFRVIIIILSECFRWLTTLRVVGHHPNRIFIIENNVPGAVLVAELAAAVEPVLEGFAILVIKTGFSAGLQGDRADVAKLGPVVGVGPGSLPGVRQADRGFGVALAPVTGVNFMPVVKTGMCCCVVAIIL